MGAQRFGEEILPRKRAGVRRWDERREVDGLLRDLAIDELAEILRPGEATEAPRALLDANRALVDGRPCEPPVTSRTRQITGLRERPRRARLAADADVAWREDLRMASPARNARRLGLALAARAVVRATLAAAVQAMEMGDPALRRRGEHHGTISSRGTMVFSRPELALAM
jgi:hypothetical protein